MATREHILAAMRDLHDNATDTVWLTKHETVFERLASIYGYAGGDPATLAKMWPEYFVWGLTNVKVTGAPAHGD